MVNHNCLLTVCLAIAAACPAVNAAESAPGDRSLPICQVFPPEAFFHNGKGGRVLDVTKPPFNAKGDGTTDDTKSLCDAMRFVRDRCEMLAGPNYSYCGKKENHNWVIYLPDGTYLVSDTVDQGWPALAINILKGWSHVEFVHVESLQQETELNAGGRRGVYAEGNWSIRILGQSRQKTVIRLKDSAPGFGQGDEKAVLTFFLLATGSNVNLGNILENVTIDTGKGNPGAVGLRWNSSNWGGVRNVAIRSGDGDGRIGLMMDRRNATGYHHDLVIDGFDTGMELRGGGETVVALEYATFSHQRNTAIQVGNTAGGNCLSARKLLVADAPVALRAGPSAQVILLDSQLTGATESDAALTVEPDGYLLARNIALSAYRAAVTKDGEAVLKGTRIEEYTSTAPVPLSPETKNAAALSQPVSAKDWPVVLPEQDVSKWANVDDFGAVGDGIADDTAAIQRAMNSGKPVVYLPKANYVVNGTVNIPATVREVTCLFGSVHRSVATERDGPGLLRVAEASAEPLRIHQAITAGGVFLDHEADRTVVLEDVLVFFQHCRGYAAKENMVFPSPAAQNTAVWRLYRNSRPTGAPKEVFVNDCLFFSADDADGKLALENVRTWARMINNEHLPGAQFSFRRSNAWILGFKSENAETLFRAEDRSRLEVLGGSFLNWSPHKGPVIVSRDSSVSAVCFLWGWGVLAKTVVQTESNGVVTTLSDGQFPRLGKTAGTVVVLDGSGSTGSN